jgi:flagellar motor switch protein FliG
MVYKLTDDQKDLIMTIMYDLDNIHSSDDIENSEIIESINMKSMLMHIYNNGKYENSHREILNSIREFWMNNIYNKGYSTWDYIRESPV